MRILTNRDYWDEVHKTNQTSQKTSNVLKEIVKKIYRTIFNNHYSYKDYLFWEKFYNNFMPNKPGLKVLEVGSAPGYFLIQLHKRFNYIPFGIEFSREGFSFNKNLFMINKLNSNNLIYADFFSKEIQYKYKEAFDIVISRGFVEHFTDTYKVIFNHLNLLKKGGLLFIMIPNLMGFNYELMKFFNRDVISKHNLNIMDKANFLKIVSKFRLKKLYCNYFGTFSFGIFLTENNLFKALILNLLKKLQYYLDIMFLILFKRKGFETKYFSPFLVYVGIKKN